MTNAQPCDGLGAVGSASTSVGTPEDATPARRPIEPKSDLQWRILALLAREKVNAWSAYELLRVSCLRTHVSHLEKKGVFICREWFAMPTQFGKTVPAVRYWIEPGEWDRLTSSPRERARGAA
jgi:hypothetical protein